VVSAVARDAAGLATKRGDQKMTYYRYLTKAQEAAFWHRERNSIGVAISARDRQAVKDGKKVTVEQRPPPKPKKPQR